LEGLGDDAEITAKPTGPSDAKKVAKIGRNRRPPRSETRSAPDDYCPANGEFAADKRFCC
jgi:hypothetical protein